MVFSTLAIDLDIPILILIIVLIMFSAFFSMSETVFSTANVVRIKLAIEERKSGAKKALYCLEHFDKILTTLLVGNNIVNIALATISVGFFAKLMGESAYIEAVSTLVVTVLVLIFGEICPKTLAKKYADNLALKISNFVYFFSIILYPIVIIFRGLQRLISGKDDKNHAPDEEELEAILDNMENEGAIEEGERDLIRNVFDLNDRSVEDIMVPRIEMLAININTTKEEVTKTLLDNQYSRIPVYREDKDHIIGILYERDYFAALISKNQFTLEKILRPVKYVSAAMKVDALIKELQHEKKHIAVVSGEYGDTLGIVTMEDALEEIVGEIYDEHDDAGTNDLFFYKEEDGSYLVDGEMYVEDLFEKIGVGQAPDDVPNKVASWLYEKCEDIPEAGYSFSYVSSYAQLDEDSDEYVDYSKKITFEIAEVKGRRIKAVKVTVSDATEEELEEQENETD